MKKIYILLNNTDIPTRKHRISFDSKHGQIQNVFHRYLRIDEKHTVFIKVFFSGFKIVLLLSIGAP